MGYEVRLFAVERLTDFDDGGPAFASVVAEIDLCKIGDGKMSDLHTASTPLKPRAYVYGLDGDTQFKLDRYDKPLSVMEVDDVIKAIEHDNKTEKYRRFTMALAMLKVFRKEFGKEAKVLGYGH